VNSGGGQIANKALPLRERTKNCLPQRLIFKQSKENARCVKSENIEKQFAESHPAPADGEQINFSSQQFLRTRNALLQTHIM